MYGLDYMWHPFNEKRAIEQCSFTLFERLFLKPEVYLVEYLDEVSVTVHIKMRNGRKTEKKISAFHFYRGRKKD